MRSKIVTRKQFTKNSSEEFKNLLSEESWCEVFNHLEVNYSLKAFMDIFLYYYHTAFAYNRVKSGKLTVWCLTTHIWAVPHRWPPNVAFYIFIQQIQVLNILNMLYTLHLFSSKCSLFHNANLFGSCIIHILYTGCAKIKKK